MCPPPPRTAGGDCQRGPQTGAHHTRYHPADPGGTGRQHKPGPSNVSFGLPDRKILNVAYLALAISRGLTIAITDPIVPENQMALLACDLLIGRDQYSARWIKAFRKREKAKAEVAL